VGSAIGTTTAAASAAAPMPNATPGWARFEVENTTSSQAAPVSTKNTGSE
jgi:hypothetical protein